MGRNVHFFVYAVAMVFATLSCSSSASIYSMCEKDKAGHYIVKWEVSHDPQTGTVEIYTSHTADLVKNQSTPTLVASVTDRVAVFRHRSPASVREFFYIKGNNSASGIITNRHIPFESIYNFRDLGGYFTESDQQMRWGKIYRSGSLFQVSPKDTKHLKKLGIKTVIDLRSFDETLHYPLLRFGATIRPAYINELNSFEMQDKVLRQGISHTEAAQTIRDGYVNILTDNTKQIRFVFQTLLDNDCYPILIQDNLGKDRTGIISYLILRAIGISEEEAINDYLLSNRYINIQNYAGMMHGMPEATQEAMTAVLRSNQNYIDYAIDSILKKYGSLDSYFSKELRLSVADRNKLKKILLY